MEQSKLIFDSAAQNARMAADVGIKKAELAIEGSRGAAQVLSQLTASVLSGVNLSASANSSASSNYSESRTGELP